MKSVVFNSEKILKSVIFNQKNILKSVLCPLLVVIFKDRRIVSKQFELPSEAEYCNILIVIYIYIAD